MACAHFVICSRELQETCARTMITVTLSCTCRIAMLYKCRCDAKSRVHDRQSDNQPTADNADNFTTWTGSLEHTCVNCILVAIHHLSPMLRSTLLCIQRRSCPAIFLTPSYWGQIRNFDGDRNTGWATLAVRRMGASSLFVMRNNQRAAKSPYNFALFHPLPSVA